MYRLRILSALQHLPFHHFGLLVVLVGRAFDLRGVVQPNKSCSKANAVVVRQKTSIVAKPIFSSFLAGSSNPVNERDALSTHVEIAPATTRL